MEREIERFDIQEILFKEAFSRWAFLLWKTLYRAGSLKPEGQVAARQLFEELTGEPQKRNLSQDSQGILVGFERSFRNLDVVPHDGPVLVLSWHYPKGPLSYWGTLLLISEAVRQVRQEEISWIGSTRFRLPWKKEGLAVAERFWQKVTEDCFGGVYFKHKGENYEAIKKVRAILKEGGVIGLMPDDVDNAISPPQKIEKLNLDAVKHIAQLAKIPELSIIAAVPAYFEDNKTLALDFIPITERPGSSEEDELIKWGDKIRQILSPSFPLDNEKDDGHY